MRKAKFRRDRRARTAGRPAGQVRGRTVVITAHTVISRSCGEVTNAPGWRDGITGSGNEAVRGEFRNAGRRAVNCLGEWSG